MLSVEITRVYAEAAIVGALRMWRWAWNRGKEHPVMVRARLVLNIRLPQPQPYLPSTSLMNLRRFFSRALAASSHLSELSISFSWYRGYQPHPSTLHTTCWQHPIVEMLRSGFDRHKLRNTSKKQPYVYSPLRASSEEIRLLTLLPGPFGTMVQCELYTTNLDKHSPPCYEALSYAWGSEEDPVAIHLGDGSLSVTQNLGIALQHLRYPDRSRTLWIDAICL